MQTTGYYSRHSLKQLYKFLEDIHEDKNPEEYAEIAEEIARRTAEGGAYYSPRGTTILVLGIVGLVLSMVCGILGLIVALVAWSMGDTALKQIKAAHYTDLVEINNVRIGRICGASGAVIFLGILILKWLAIR